MPPTRGLTEAQKAEHRRRQEEARMQEWQKRNTLILKRMICYYGTKHEEVGQVIRRSRTAVTERMNGSTPWTAKELMLVANFFDADDQTRAALLGGSGKCRWEY